MATHRLDPSQWQTYFDRVSRGLGGRQVSIEVTGLTLGDQIEADKLSLTGLSYDPKDNLVEIATEVVDHLIRQPREIYVEEDVEGLHNVEIVDPDGNHQIIRLQTPLALPVP